MFSAPTIGYGTTYTTDEVAYASVSKALEVGYRIINTCAAYENERGIGRAIAATDIPRDELTIVSLDSNSKRGSEDAKAFDGYQASLDQIHEQLECLSTNYIDVYMINWPVPRYMENVWRTLNTDSWRAMEDCVEKGLIKRIGVSNFLPDHIEALLQTARLPIAANQLEIHPNFQQHETVKYCREHGIKIMSWSPLFKGKAIYLPVICELAEKYRKTPAQIILRWDIQNDVIPVVCSANEDRMRSNIDVFDFEINDADMRIIDGLETGEHIEAFSYVRQKESI